MRPPGPVALRRRVTSAWRPRGSTSTGCAPPATPRSSRCRSRPWRRARPAASARSSAGNRRPTARTSSRARRRRAAASSRRPCPAGARRARAGHYYFQASSGAPRVLYESIRRAVRAHDRAPPILNFSSISQAAFMTGRSLSLPMITPTSGAMVFCIVLSSQR